MRTSTDKKKKKRFNVKIALNGHWPLIFVFKQLESSKTVHKSFKQRTLKRLAGFCTAAKIKQRKIHEIKLLLLKNPSTDRKQTTLQR